MSYTILLAEYIDKLEREDNIKEAKKLFESGGLNSTKLNVLVNTTAGITVKH